jgi:hypothetical protein
MVPVAIHLVPIMVSGGTSNDVEEALPKTDSDFKNGVIVPPEK